MVNLGFWIGFDLKTAKMKLSLHDLLIVKATAPLCNDITSGLPAEIEACKKQYEYYRDKLLDFK